MLFLYLYLEDINHLYFNCMDPNYTLINTLKKFNFNITTKILDCEFYWNNYRFKFKKNIRFLLDSLFIIISWFIWFERNQRIFNNNNCHLNKLIVTISSFCFNRISNPRYKLAKNILFKTYHNKVNRNINFFKLNNNFLTSIIVLLIFSLI